jgi:type IV pilus assembly protein PilC
MPKFAYVALAPDGARTKGVEVAETLSAARAALRERKVTIADLAAKKNGFNIQISTKHLKRSDLMHLSRQLAAFIRAGIPILDAIQTLADETDADEVRRVLEAIGQDLRTGSTLAEAFNRHPDDFPSFYLGILASAELTGNLDSVLDHLSGYLERDLEARRQIKSAMIYPGVVAAMAAFTVVVLSVFVLPKFEVFFADLNAELPLVTRLLLAITQLMTTWWWVLAFVVAAGAATGYLAYRSPNGRLFLDRFVLRVPVVGEVIRFSTIERFTRLMASMVAAGVPLPEAMSVATASLNNRVFQVELAKARTAMVEGGGLATPMLATGLFPGVAAQMIRVGEDTGTIDTQLKVAAEFYEKELDYKIKKLTTIIEPVVIVIMGGIVGFVAIALVSAMYGIFRAANV